jgi:hypothetical protein
VCGLQLFSLPNVLIIWQVRDRLDFLSPDDREWMLFRTAEQILFPPSTAGS